MNNFILPLFIQLIIFFIIHLTIYFSTKRYVHALARLFLRQKSENARTLARRVA